MTISMVGIEVKKLKKMFYRATLMDKQKKAMNARLRFKIRHWSEEASMVHMEQNLIVILL